MDLARASAGVLRALAAPERNELQSAESDDYNEVMALAEELVGRWMATWVHAHEHTGANATAYRVVAEWKAHRR